MSGDVKKIDSCIKSDVETEFPMPIRCSLLKMGFPDPHDSGDLTSGHGEYIKTEPLSQLNIVPLLASTSAKGEPT